MIGSHHHRHGSRPSEVSYEEMVSDGYLLAFHRYTPLSSYFLDRGSVLMEVYVRVYVSWSSDCCEEDLVVTRGIARRVHRISARARKRLGAPHVGARGHRGLDRLSAARGCHLEEAFGDFAQIDPVAVRHAYMEKDLLVLLASTKNEF